MEKILPRACAKPARFRRCRPRRSLRASERLNPGTPAIYRHRGLQSGAVFLVKPFWGSFSAVSTPIFATEYSFSSIFRDLLSTRFANLCTAPNSKFQQKIIHNFCKLNIESNWIFQFVWLILPFWGVISMKFCLKKVRISRHGTNSMILNIIPIFEM